MIAALIRRQKTTPIGLDIGSCGVRAAQLVQSGDSCRVFQAASVHVDHLPAVEPKRNRPNARREENVGATGPDSTIAPLLLTQCLQSCLAQGEFRGQTVMTALCPPDIEYHALELPAADPAQLAQIVPFEVERLLAVHHDRVEARHWMLPKTHASAPNAIGVAAQYGKVVETVDLCRHAGVVCSGVDTAATAVGRVGAMLNNWASQDVWGVLDLAYRQARLILCAEDVVVLVRTVGAGGRIWTDRIADGLGTTVKTAEVQKLDHGIALTARGIRRESSDPPASELASVLLGILRSDLNELAAEVKRSYEYVLSCYPKKRAADLVVVGGGAAMVNVPEYLNVALGIPVNRASAYLQKEGCRLHYASARHNPLEMMTLAIGTALGVSKDDGRH